MAQCRAAFASRQAAALAAVMEAAAALPMADVTKLVLAATGMGVDQAALTAALDGVRRRDAEAQQRLRDAAAAEPFNGATRLRVSWKGGGEGCICCLAYSSDTCLVTAAAFLVACLGGARRVAMLRPFPSHSAHAAPFLARRSSNEPHRALVDAAEAAFSSACEACGQHGLSADVAASRRAVDKRRAAAADALKQASDQGQDAEAINSAIVVARWAMSQAFDRCNVPCTCHDLMVDGTAARFAGSCCILVACALLSTPLHWNLKPAATSLCAGFSPQVVWLAV